MRQTGFPFKSFLLALNAYLQKTNLGRNLGYTLIFWRTRNLLCWNCHGVGYFGSQLSHDRRTRCVLSFSLLVHHVGPINLSHPGGGWGLFPGRHVAMGQNPPPPVNIPIQPTKIGPKMGGEFNYQPEWDPLERPNDHIWQTPNQWLVSLAWGVPRPCAPCEPRARGSSPAQRRS